MLPCRLGMRERVMDWRKRWIVCLECHLPSRRQFDGQEICDDCGVENTNTARPGKDYVGRSGQPSRLHKIEALGFDAQAITSPRHMVAIMENCSDAANRVHKLSRYGVSGHGMVGRRPRDWDKYDEAQERKREGMRKRHLKNYRKNRSPEVKERERRRIRRAKWHEQRAEEERKKARKLKTGT